MKRIRVTAFLLMYLLIPLHASSTTFYYIETIKVGDNAGSIASDGLNLMVRHGSPHRVAFYDMKGNFLESFDTLGTTFGMTYNGSRGMIIIGGGVDVGGSIGRLYEMNPENGDISDSVAEGIWLQPYLAYTGSLILSSWGATGLNGILNIPVDRFNATNYDYVDTISITIDTGTDVTGISHIPIAFNNGYLYVKLAIPGLNDKVYEYHSDLSLSEIITLSHFGPNEAIGAMTFIGNDLFVVNSGTDDIYRYSPIPPQYNLSVLK
jgi:hypothetical protein